MQLDLWYHFQIVKCLINIKLKCIFEKNPMRTITFFLLLAIALPIRAQNSMLSFDGIDDYVYFNAEVGDNIRTIEFWFRPDIDYGPSLDDYACLVCREGGAGMPNIHEFFIAITPDYIPNPGTMRFSYFVSPSEYYDVYSERNYWDAGQWYHIAGVFHPDFGMMLYVNGNKQPGVVDYYEATTATGDTVALGTWGFPPPAPDRYFNGAIEDLRFSYDAEYLESFTPSCPDLPATENTAGLWNMNEGTAYILYDNSGNGHNGHIVGALWIQDDPCPVSMEEPGDILSKPLLNIFPLPANDIMTIDLNSPGEYILCLYNASGIRILERKIKGEDNKSINLDVASLPQGIYYLWLYTDNYNETRKVLIAR